MRQLFLFLVFMKKKLTYTFSAKEMHTLDLIISDYLSQYEIDLDFLDESLSKLVLFDWYKRNLSKFKFPQDQNKITFKQVEYIAFLSHFKDTEHFMLDDICRQIVIVLTGGTLPKKKLLK